MDKKVLLTHIQTSHACPLASSNWARTSIPAEIVELEVRSEGMQCKKKNKKKYKTL